MGLPGRSVESFPCRKLGPNSSERSSNNAVDRAGSSADNLSLCFAPAGHGERHPTILELGRNPAQC